MVGVAVEVEVGVGEVVVEVGEVVVVI